MQRMNQALDEIRERKRLDRSLAPFANESVRFLLGTGALNGRHRTVPVTSAQSRIPPGHILSARVYAAQGRYRESVDTCLKGRSS